MNKIKLKKLVVLCIFLLISGCTSPPTAQTEINTLQTESVDSESEKKQFFVWGPSFYSSIVDIQVYANNEFIAGGTGTIITEEAFFIKKAASSALPLLTGLFSFFVAPELSSVAPKPPRITLKNERFIPLHIM